MDNLRAHKASVMNTEWSPGFERLFLPPYSCALNPIERLWSVIKNEWRKTCHIPNVVKATDEVIKEASARIKAMIDNVDKDKQINIARSHIKFMARSLRGLLV